MQASSEDSHKVGEGGGLKALMDALASSPREEIAACAVALEPLPQAAVVRGPEVGLVMVRGRIGGDGAPFNLGEATVTRASVRLDDGTLGHAYALGQDHAKARISAILAAMWVQGGRREAIERHVTEPLSAARAADAAKTAREAAATKVDFFTMVRGEDD